MNNIKYTFHGIPVITGPDKDFTEIKLPISMAQYIEDLTKIKEKYMEEPLAWITKEKTRSGI